MPPPSPRPVRAMEEFIAVVFENEVWMGLVDFKSEKQLPEESEAGKFPFLCVSDLSSRFETVVCDSCS
jgi:hypothetical protein